jgi:hypothetical protein
MTTSEKLQAIKFRCEALLETASERTPGEWEPCSEGVASARGYLHTACDPHNAAFIASCAGPAEAGWRATIAAIDECLRYPFGLDDQTNLNPCSAIADEIITAWEGLV